VVVDCCPVVYQRGKWECPTHAWARTVVRLSYGAPLRVLAGPGSNSDRARNVECWPYVSLGPPGTATVARSGDRPNADGGRDNTSAAPRPWRRV